MSIIAKTRLKRKIKYILEALTIYSIYWILYIIPIDYASNFMGWIASTIGPKLRISNIARINLKKCFPSFSEPVIENLICKMWDNLGRIVGEFPHWHKMNDQEYSKRVKFITPTKKINTSALLLSGHFGNFDLIAKVAANLSNRGLRLVYRPANNPYIDHMINRERNRNNLTMFPKGKAGLKQVLEALGSGDIIGMMVDQKMNDGIEIPFFGMPASSTSLPARLAIKFKVPIYIGKVTRKRGAYYNVEIKKVVVKAKDNPIALSSRINLILEDWIREQPEQWFWIHRRWKLNYCQPLVIANERK